MGRSPNFIVKEVAGNDCVSGGDQGENLTDAQLLEAESSRDTTDVRLKTNRTVSRRSESTVVLLCRCVALLLTLFADSLHVVVGSSVKLCASPSSFVYHRYEAGYVINTEIFE